MFSLVSLLVAAALVSQHSGFEANAQIDNSKLTLENNLHPNGMHPNPNVIHPKKLRRIKKFVHIWSLPEEVRRVAGERAELSCIIMGNPAPAIHWEKNGQVIDEQYDEEVNEILPPISFSLAEVVSKLIITGTTPGSDTYTCVGTAAGGALRHAADATVYTLPAQEDETDLLALEKISLLAPTITYYIDNLFQIKGTTAILPCRAASASKPVLYWQDRNMRVIYNSPRRRVLPSGDLLINDLRFDEDMGNFTCTVKNVFGKDSVVTFVYVNNP